jgi:hypothetical protein
VPARRRRAPAVRARARDRVPDRDDILDCSGDTIETGKIAGTDLRDGTPTLPLLLAAQRGRVVRSALAGGPLDGALVRVAATGALERSGEWRSTTLGGASGLDGESPRGARGLTTRRRRER